MLGRTTVIVAASCLALTDIAGTQSPSTALRGQSPSLGVAGAVNGTPSLAVLGRTVAAVWTTTKEGAADVYVATSTDGGGTFSSPKRVNDQPGDASANNEQPPRVAMSGSAAAPVLTVVWSKRNEGPQRARRDAIRMARSVDGGRTFGPARFTHEAAVTGARGWESLAVRSDGRVHAVWLDGRDAERKMAAAAHAGTPHKGQPPQDIYHGTIAPDGAIVESVIATGVCFCCKTAVAIDGRGAVYAAWRHIFPGSMRDIAFAMSADGRRFDPFVRVSEDNWELNGCPEDGPTLAVDETGTIHIAWATVVDDGEAKALFYATSRDGKTFSPRVRLPVGVAATPGHPQLTVTADGGVAIVWDELVDGLRRVVFTRVSRSGMMQPPQILNRDESASNPVIVRVDRNLLVAWTAKSAAEPSVIKLRRMPA